MSLEFYARILKTANALIEKVAQDATGESGAADIEVASDLHRALGRLETVAEGLQQLAEAAPALPAQSRWVPKETGRFSSDKPNDSAAPQSRPSNWSLTGRESDTAKHLGMAELTVGKLRELIADMPEEAPIFPMFDEPPSDDMPSVQLRGIQIQAGRPQLGLDYGLAVMVSLIPLNSENEDEDD